MFEKENLAFNKLPLRGFSNGINPKKGVFIFIFIIINLMLIDFHIG